MGPDQLKDRDRQALCRNEHKQAMNKFNAILNNSSGKPCFGRLGNSSPTRDTTCGNHFTPSQTCESKMGTYSLQEHSRTHDATPLKNRMRFRALGAHPPLCCLTTAFELLIEQGAFALRATRKESSNYPQDVAQRRHIKQGTTCTKDDGSPEMAERLPCETDPRTSPDLLLRRGTTFGSTVANRMESATANASAHRRARPQAPMAAPNSNLAPPRPAPLRRWNALGDDDGRLHGTAPRTTKGRPRINAKRSMTKVSGQCEQSRK